MKKLLSLIIIAIAFSSCQEDVKFNTPGFQGLKDDVLWRANDVRAYVSSTGKLRIEALTQYDEVVLNTGNTIVGTYNLGSIVQNNNATYTSNVNETPLIYTTVNSAGPVMDINLPLISGGTGYQSASSVVTTTTGSGTGLKVNTVVNSGGRVTNLTIASRGDNYLPNDLITVTGGNLNCKFRVSTNGEIKITEYDNVNMTVSGTFKFNASNVENNPAGGPILNYQYGAFYKVQIFPGE